MWWRHQSSFLLLILEGRELRGPIFGLPWDGLAGPVRGLTCGVHFELRRDSGLVLVVGLGSRCRGHKLLIEALVGDWVIDELGTVIEASILLMLGRSIFGYQHLGVRISNREVGFHLTQSLAVCPRPRPQVNQILSSGLSLADTHLTSIYL